MEHMRVLALATWLAALWLAIGAEAAWGGGMPGIALLVALAGGLWCGPWAGVLLGAGAGVADAVLCGRDLVLLGTLGALAGVVAGWLPRWFSRQHVLVAMLAAFCISFVLCLALGLHDLQALPAVLLFAARRGAVNALWLFPIYGIVFLVSRRGSTSPVAGQY